MCNWAIFSFTKFTFLSVYGIPQPPILRNIRLNFNSFLRVFHFTKIQEQGSSLIPSQQTKVLTGQVRSQISACVHLTHT